MIEVESGEHLPQELAKSASMESSLAATSGLVGNRDTLNEESANHRQPQGLSDRLAELELELAAQAGLHRQAEQALALTRSRYAKALDEVVLLRESEKSANSRADQLRLAHSEAEKALAAATHRLAVLESTIRQRAEENSQAWSELASTRKAADELGESLKRELARASELEERLSEADAWTFKLAGDRRAAEEQLAKLTRALTQEKKARETAESALVETDDLLARTLRQFKEAAHLNAELEGRVAGLERELEDVWKKSAQLERDLTAERAGKSRVEELHKEARDDIVIITHLLQSSEDKAVRTQAQIDWLGKVNDVMLTSKTRWSTLVPSGWRRKQQFAALAKHGLFDAKSYLIRYPDVRASGQDPLRHYILHGMAEGRTF